MNTTITMTATEQPTAMPMIRIVDVVAAGAAEAHGTGAGPVGVIGGRGETA
jgi:hypothetical protein